MPTRLLVTPLGPMTVTADDDHITALDWRNTETVPDQDSPLLREAGRQILAYFDRRLRAFSLPLALVGSAFQRRLWRCMLEIGYGETRSYGDIAHLIDSGPRAVGHGCGRNPLPLLVPCHRVVAAGGKLGGYSGGGGLDTKRFLLRLEAGGCFT